MPAPALFRLVPVLVALSLAATPLRAGDPAAGAEAWRACRACHMIVAPDGQTIQRGGQVGPNLFGVLGRPAAAVEGFAYSPDLAAAGAAGLVWTAETLVPWLQNPDRFLRDRTGNPAARSAMNARLPTGAADIVAYLASLGG